MKIQFALAFALLALAPVAASAETQDEQNACMNDAFSVCGHAIPDRERVAACLAQNMHRISALPHGDAALCQTQQPTAASRQSARGGSRTKLSTRTDRCGRPVERFLRNPTI